MNLSSDEKKIRIAIRKLFNSKYEEEWDTPLTKNIQSAIKDSSLGCTSRLKKIATMKYSHLYSSMDTIVITMKLVDIKNNLETNYGSMFCESINSIGKHRLNKNINENSIISKVAFLYYSASPSYVSCDGEYRSNFNMYDILQNAIVRFPNIWDDLYTYILRIISRRHWSLQTSYFYPTMLHEESSNELEFVVLSQKYLQKILVISWFNFIMDYINNIEINHMNNQYKDIFLKNIDDDVKFIKNIIYKHSSQKIKEFDCFLNNIDYNNYYTKINIMPYKCGYKMIPLNVKEVQEPLKIKYTSWREYFISNKLNDIVVNNIYPGFSIILDWFYIKNSRKGLYDNKSQFNRMKNSEVAKDILQKLKEAQRSTYFAAENLKSISKSSCDIKQWISNQFKVLNEKITDPINYSIEELIMSEVTLAFVNEYVGRTLSNNIILTNKSKVIDKSLGYPLQIKGFDYFNKYIFEVLYGLAVIHTRAKIIHGDLHLNNTTIGHLYKINEDVIENKNLKYKVVYVIDDNYQFVFPTNGNFASIIDFSRSIINVNNYEFFEDYNLPKSFELISDINEFKTGEIKKIINLIIKIYPSKENKRDDLFIICKNHFDEVFKIATGLDIYIFVYKLKSFLSTLNFTINKNTIKLVNDIFKKIDEFLSVNINKLLQNKDEIFENFSNMEYPIINILKTVFNKYLDNVKDTDVVTDIFILNKKLKYSISKYETFPEFIKTVKYEKNKKIVFINKPNENRKNLLNENYHINRKNLEMLNFIATRHKDRFI